jgi:hypothetical protein
MAALMVIRQQIRLKIEDTSLQGLHLHALNMFNPSCPIDPPKECFPKVRST